MVLRPVFLAGVGRAFGCGTCCCPGRRRLETDASAPGPRGSFLTLWISIVTASMFAECSTFNSRLSRATFSPSRSSCSFRSASRHEIARPALPLSLFVGAFRSEQYCLSHRLLRFQRPSPLLSVRRQRNASSGSRSYRHEVLAPTGTAKLIAGLGVGPSTCPIRLSSDQPAFHIPNFAFAALMQESLSAPASASHFCAATL